MYETDCLTSEIVLSEILLLFFISYSMCTRKKLVSSQPSTAAKISIKLEDGIEIVDLTRSLPSNATESIEENHDASADNGKCRRRS